MQTITTIGLDIAKPAPDLKADVALQSYHGALVRHRDRWAVRDWLI
jgi:hypothetical protein